MGLWHTHGSPNPGQKTRPYNNQQKKRICKIVDFAVPADHRIKLKECEKKNKSTLLENWKNYGTWRWPLYQLWLVLLLQWQKDNYRVWRTWKLADEWKPSKRQHYWKRSEYWEESWRLEETFCQSNSRERPSAKTNVKNSKGVNHNNDNATYLPKRL